jgi:PKD repeat protein
MHIQKTCLLKILIAALLILPAAFAIAQPSCQIIVSGTTVCVGNTISFTVNYSGTLTPDSITWEFGDGSKDSSGTVIHKYVTQGKYVPSVRVKFPDGTVCLHKFEFITVVPLPVAKFVLISNNTQCLKGNTFCFVDSSAPLPGKAPIVNRTIDYGDGSIDNTTPISTKTLCHTYGHSGVYTITMEVADSNGCVHKVMFEHMVTVTDDPKANFKRDITKVCGLTTAYFYNLSTIPQSDVKSFKWIFDDGSIDSVNWNGPVHNYLYKGVGTYNPKLVIVNKAGCPDTFSAPVDVFGFDVPLKINHDKNNICYNGNSINFFVTNIPGALYYWNFGDTLSNNNVAGGSMASHSFTTCGKFIVSLYLKLLNGCDTTLFDTITILGPKVMVNGVNLYQCVVKDTVIFKNYSKYCNANDVYRLWDFGDPFAPQCTTDTKNGINVGMNCNFSKDSTDLKHWYPPGKETCFSPTLYLRDNVTGCDDLRGTPVILKHPEAKGLTFSGIQCLNKIINFYLPPCGGYEQIWMNFDSACGKNNFKPVIFLMNKYIKTCDSRGYVTVGVVTRIGNCYDTIWYHKFLHLLEVNADLAPTADYGCSPFTVNVSLKDTIQFQTKVVEWRWGDNTSTFDYIPLGDSILKSQSHTYTKPGPYVIRVRVENLLGCDSNDIMPIGVGTYKKLVADTVVCPGDIVHFYDTVRYYKGLEPTGMDLTNYWALNNGIEVLSWDFGDGNGFTVTGSQPFHVYDKPGVYTVRLAIKDKAGCLDTLVKNDWINVVDVVADFSVDSVILCPQHVQFFDSSYTADPGTGKSGSDSITNWMWDFGDGKTPSYLQHPKHLYTSSGTFIVTLVVTNKTGCADTISKPVIIKGPEPRFRISSDTVGCYPFKASFENLSKDVKNWIWRFGDGVDLFDTTGGNVSHTYMNPGIYTIFLYGEDTVTNPVTGNKYFCDVEFPDTLVPNARRFKIYVQDIPRVNTSYKNPVCVDENVVFEDSSDSKYTRYHWYFHDGDTGNAVVPNGYTRSFDSAGTYSFAYKPLYVPGLHEVLCVDSITKSIVVTDVLADFEMDTTMFPRVRFINRSSANAIKYKWDFGHEASGNDNESEEKDPWHDYSGDTLEHDVCLIAYNQELCEDKVCKKVKNTYFIYLKLYNVFTPVKGGLGDGLNDAFDIDIIGEEYYLLNIYNRWGEKVFTGTEDGVGNDGRNWDGTNIFTGQLCGSGVYYYVFDYKFRHQDQKQVHGSVTLLGR